MCRHLLNDKLGTCLINEGTDDHVECSGYRKSWWKTGFFFLLTVLSLGLPLLLVYWQPKWRVRWKYSRCYLIDADYVLLKNKEGQHFVAAVQKQNMTKYPKEFECLMKPIDTQRILNIEAALVSNQGYYFRYFIYQHLRYIWNWNLACFEKQQGYNQNILCNELYERFKGFSTEQRRERSLIFGENTIDVEVKSYKKLLIEEILNPFYIFQIFSIALWSVDDYYYFAACIFTVSFLSILVSLYKTRKQSETIHSMVVASFPTLTNVLQKNNDDVVPSRSIVPGDVLIIPPMGCTMACDAVLILGNCIVNESMLTGESIPITKTPLLFQEGEIFDVNKFKHHILYSGTKVIQTRYYGSDHVLAVVIRTGFNTAKGDLIRSILFPKPVDFKFYNDSLKFIGFLAIIASLGMIYGAAVYIRRKASASFIIKRVLDIITIVVPPALPAAITVGSLHAQNRMRLKNIFCTSPPRINMSGKLKLFCFDKTGTLTEEGLDFMCVLPVHERRFKTEVRDVSDLAQDDVLLAAMASCHGLTIIEGHLAGDPLDIKMFEATKWKINEMGSETTMYDRLAPTVVSPPPLSTRRTPLLDGEVPYEIGILRQFPFSSSMQMMSVVTRTLGKQHMDLYAKGAPEKIISLCQDMTVPPDVNALLHYYAVKGFRVLALAWRKLSSRTTWHQIQRIKREKVEKDLVFVGLIIMQNTLKPETTPVISQLKAAKIRLIMVTGDNMHTAISVARESGMVLRNDKIMICKAFTQEEGDSASIEWEPTELPVREVDEPFEINTEFLEVRHHYAIDGKSFSIVGHHFPDVMQKLAVCGTIYARMAPDQKTQLVELLQAQGYIVGMCGDGANDCGALKAAHVGISLSDAEASVAAPFTSKIQNIECIPVLIKEGRCSLVTSFSVFKYMALYSIIQFVSVLILYTYYTNLADFQFLYIDLAITTSVAVLMGYTQPSDDLVDKQPNGSLLGIVVISSIIFQIVMSMSFQIGALLFLFQQPWYTPVNPDINEKFTECYEETIIFCISSFQYLIVAVAFSRGKPFRHPIYKNVPLLISLIILTLFSTVLLLYPGPLIASFFELVHRNDWPGLKFRLWLLTLPVVNLVLSVLIETLLYTNAFKNVYRTCIKKRNSKHLYKKIEMELRGSSELPTFGEINRLNTS